MTGTSQDNTDTDVHGCNVVVYDHCMHSVAIIYG